LSTVVVSVRVRREVKEELERAGIDVGEVVRRYLEELAWRLRIERVLEKWDRLLEGVKPSGQGFAARSVREDRDSH
jgi:hypothetical protein